MFAWPPTGFVKAGWNPSAERVPRETLLTQTSMLPMRATGSELEVRDGLMLEMESTAWTDNAVKTNVCADDKQWYDAGQAMRIGGADTAGRKGEEGVQVSQR